MANDIRQQGVSILTVLATLVSLITLLVWVYAANRNLPSLRPTTKVYFTPGWSVGCYFVPVINFIMPYHAMREIWEHSDPKRLSAGSPQQRASSAALVGLWWGLRIASGILGYLVSMMAVGSITIDDLLNISWVAVGLTVAIDMPLASCQILVIRRIQVNQEERHRMVAEGHFTTPVSGASENPFAHLA